MLQSAERSELLTDTTGPDIRPAIRVVSENLRTHTDRWPILGTTYIRAIAHRAPNNLSGDPPTKDLPPNSTERQSVLPPRIPTTDRQCQLHQLWKRGEVHASK